MLQQKLAPIVNKVMFQCLQMSSNTQVFGQRVPSWIPGVFTCCVTFLKRQLRSDYRF